MQRFVVPVVSYRRIATPFESKENYIAIIRIADLPDLSEWRRVNVRDVKLTGRVPVAIENSLRTDQDFVFMNRGLVVNVDKIEFNNKNSTIAFEMTDPRLHGLLDGGHTYSILWSQRDTLHLDQFIKVEFLRGFEEDDILKVVEARNTSNQVQDKSLLNLQGAFEPLKQEIAHTVYADKVAYKENEQDKPIDIRQLISFLFLFDVSYHGDQAQTAIRAYQSKAACLHHFSENQERFQGLYPIADNIFQLWDYIHLLLPSLYADAVQGGRFGALSGIDVLEKGKKVELSFINAQSDYVIPDAMKYPLLAAFRAFVQVDESSGVHYWDKGINPFNMLEGDLGKSLAYYVANSVKETRNPNKTGKSVSLYTNCYQAARIAYLTL